MVFRKVFLLTFTLCAFFNVSANADSKIKTNDYFLESTMSILDGPTQYNEGSLFRVNDDLFVMRRLGQIFGYSPDTREWNFVSQFPLKEIVQEYPDKQGFSGVKGVLFLEEYQKLFVSSVNIENGIAKLDIHVSRFYASTNRFEKFRKFLSLPLSVSIPFSEQNENANYPNLSQSGGQLLRYSRKSFLLTVGNFGDSWQLDAMEKNTLRGRELLGSSVLIDSTTASLKIFTTGHRNSQGLAVDQTSGKVFSVEHGQEGGDELNLLIYGRNYGWPSVTLGHPYSNLDGFYLNHPTYYKKSLSDVKSTPPVFAWSPSVAPSRIIQIREIPHWKNDLLVATLKDMSIRRLVMSDNKVILDERIFVGFRVRDIIEHRGELYLLDDRGYVHRLRLIDRKLGK